MLMANIIAYTMHSCMSVAVVAMTDTRSNRSDVPVCIFGMYAQKMQHFCIMLILQKAF